MAIAIPLGLLIGHTGRGVALVGGLANGLRAIPALGLVLLLVVELSPHFQNVAKNTLVGLVPQGGLPYVIPIEIVLIIIAIPPMLTNTYAGVQNVDPAIRDAARGMGMKEGQIIRKVELPVALPLIMSGLRSATLQVIATAVVAARVPFLGGLGAIINNGIANPNDPQTGYTAMVCAGITVAVLAVVIDVLLVGVQRVIVSRGVSERYRKVAKPTAVTANIPEVANVQS